MVRFEDADNVRLEGIEEVGRVDGRVDDCLSGRGRLGLNVGEEEAQGMAGLGGQDGEQGDKLRRLVVGQVCQDERLGVVLVDSAWMVSVCVCVREH